MSRRARRAAALAGATLSFALAAPTALAHVGELRSAVAAGPYRLVVSALPERAGDRVALALRVIVRPHGGAPLEAARLSVVVREPGGAVRGPYRAAGFDGSFYLALPIASAEHWRALRFELELAGSLGRANGLYVPPVLLRQWPLEPVPLAVAAVAALLFAQGFWRLRRRGRRDHASLARIPLFAAGLAALVLPLVSPLDVVGDQFLLSAHMLQHVLIGDVAPALLLVSVRGPLLVFLLPRPLLPLLHRARPLGRALARLGRPGPALACWAAAFGGWHIPAAYDYAATHAATHELEHASFFVAGLLVWWLLINPARRGRLSRGARLALAGGLFALGSAISDVLLFSPRPLYPLYAGQAERVFGLSPLADQQFAGLVMAADQTLTLTLFAALLLWPLVRSQARPVPGARGPRPPRGRRVPLESPLPAP